jgi:triacylglycerol lipase
MPKPVPPATFEWVFPPIKKGYEYFQDHERNPFLHGATDFQLLNAWWLAEAALLSYAEPDFAIPIFNRAGLRVDGERPVSGRSTQCYVLYNDDFIIAAFRGTEVYRPDPERKLTDIARSVVADITADGKFGLVKFDQGAFVHRGFRKAFDEVWGPELKPRLDRLKNEKPGRTVWLTGHSLGAALATLAAARYKHVQGLYTFGSPRVGDGGFRDSFPIKSYRFVNNNDIVALVPPLAPYLPCKFRAGIYHHAGELKYIDSAHSISSDPSVSERMMDGARGSVSHLFGSTKRFKTDWTTVLLDDRVTDHGPVFYAIHIWNYYEKSLIG